MIKIIDNFLCDSYSRSILQTCLNDLRYKYDTQTSYQEKIITTPETKDNGQFVSVIINGKQEMSNISNFFLPIFFHISDAVPDLNLVSIIRLKANLLLKDDKFPENNYNIVHQDAPSGCYSAVYYCNDSDGDTFLFNEYWKGEDTFPERLTIAQRVSPKRNRLVLFESNRYHASSNPRLNRDRIVLNFVLGTEHGH